MKILQQRLLRGANMYFSRPCLAALLELDTTAELDPQAMARLPADLRTTGDAAALVAALTLHLQRACGHDPAFAHAETVGGKPAQRRVVVGYTLEHLGQAALRAAVTLVDGLLHGEAFDTAPALHALRDLTAGLELPPAMREVADEAHRLGYPVLRVSEHAHLLTVGWGSRQWRFLDGAADGDRLLTASVLQSRQLTRALLFEALIDTAEGPADTSASVRDGHATHEVAAVRELSGLAAAKIGLRDAEIGVALGGKHGWMVASVEASGAAGAEREGGRATGDASVAASGAHLDRSHAQPHRLAQLRNDPLQGRIPVIAVTGTNGKTTTTLMIAHATRHAGLRTGHTTTQGVFLDGRRIAQGDCTGYWSHRAVLTAPQVDCAVLETARGGILKRGLAYDRCTVGVLLNVSDDHLGLDGVETVEDLARVKSLVVRNAANAVLNADDAHCVAATLTQGTRAIFFSMHADSTVLKAHRQRGGCAVWLEDETIMLADGDGDGVRRVIAVADIPATVRGLARYNIANSLAATAALHAAGLTAEQIAAGLATFVSDVVTNPLRTNIFDLGRVRIVLDYAHNSAAYAALGALTRGMGDGKVLAVVSSPGDRRDDDLLRIGASCAAAFDRLFVYESASRGRPHGEAAQLISAGARHAGSAHPVETFGNAAEALQRAYGQCAPGDVMMFSCGTSITTLVDALRAVDADAAHAIEAQAA
ncbi:Mur ligase family protein [Duganella callida]|uniref:Cyanophycin synthetase n=1 Tax=Duganella callida TaxID=2561932 RepID=A0A4Y9SWW0_9BURK|nr:Mur ligase family protein [Duganella callida]TFW31166.1 hypothetical protein E4L98_00975 [Duganella callida]